MIVFRELVTATYVLCLLSLLPHLRWGVREREREREREHCCHGTAVWGFPDRNYISTFALTKIGGTFLKGSCPVFAKGMVSLRLNDLFLV